MTVYVALLRGINVGGHNRVAMADLRRLLEQLGHADVRTYIQSGNAVFTGDRRDTDALGRDLRAAMSDELGVSPTVIVRTAEELAAVADANPYAAEAAADPTTVHVAFLSAEPADPSTFAFDADAYAPEGLCVGDRVRYLHLPDGMGRSRLAVDLGKRRSDVEVTVRNWRTVEKLREMTRT